MADDEMHKQQQAVLQAGLRICDKLIEDIKTLKAEINLAYNNGELRLDMRKALTINSCTLDIFYALIAAQTLRDQRKIEGKLHERQI